MQNEGILKDRRWYVTVTEPLKCLSWSWDILEWDWWWFHSSSSSAGCCAALKFIKTLQLDHWHARRFPRSIIQSNHFQMGTNHHKMQQNASKQSQSDHRKIWNPQMQTGWFCHTETGPPPASSRTADRRHHTRSSDLFGLKSAEIPSRCELQ